MAQHTQHQPQRGVAPTAGNAGSQRSNTGGNQGGSQTAAALSDAKDAARQTGEQLKSSAQQAADSLREQGEGFFSEQKGKAAKELTTLSSAIRASADRLRGDDESHAARYAEMAADKLEGAAKFIGNQDLGSLARQLESAARRRPELFLGGMFLVGLGISRFLKASSPRNAQLDRDWNHQGSP